MKIDENDFLYIISKQKMDHKEKLIKEASNIFYDYYQRMLLLH